MKRRCFFCDSGTPELFYLTTVFYLPAISGISIVADRYAAEFAAWTKKPSSQRCPQKVPKAHCRYSPPDGEADVNLGEPLLDRLRGRSIRATDVNRVAPRLFSETGRSWDDA